MSDGPRLEVAEVFRQHAEEYLQKYGASPQQCRVLRDVQDCRTAATQNLSFVAPFRGLSSSRLSSSSGHLQGYDPAIQTP